MSIQDELLLKANRINYDELLSDLSNANTKYDLVSALKAYGIYTSTTPTKTRTKNDQYVQFADKSRIQILIEHIKFLCTKETAQKVEYHTLSFQPCENGPRKMYATLPKNGATLKMCMLPLLLDESNWLVLSDKNSESIQALDNSYSDTERERHARTLDFNNLKKIAKTRAVNTPEPHEMLISQIQRDPYISEYTKQRAKGVCQLCGLPAPFADRVGKPYLECHHIIWLSNGGPDSVENTVALCPNCHRKMHVLNNESDILKLQNIAKTSID